MKYLLLLAALPVAGAVYLVATKKAVVLDENKRPVIVDKADADAKKKEVATKKALKAAALVAQATIVPGGKVVVAKKIIESAINHAEKPAA